MNKNESIAISAAIGKTIAGNAPYITYSSDDLKRDYDEYTSDEIAALTKAGYIDGDFEKFFVIREFSNSLRIDNMPGAYMRRLFSLSKKLDADSFMHDPYIRNVKIKETRRGKILLTTADYVRGEILQYDMPYIDDDIVVPRLGFFTEPVRFPTLYEGTVPWVSVCPSEINSMKEQMERACGRVLILGLGLGYFPYIISAKSSVESITIVELSRDVIDIFEAELLPQFPHRSKIRIVHADALEFLDDVRPDEYDYCFADIWEGVVDGAEAYRLIKPHEKRLKSTVFTYWIEKEIKEYMN